MFQGVQVATLQVVQLVGLQQPLLEFLDNMVCLITSLWERDRHSKESSSEFWRYKKLEGIECAR